MIDLAAKMLNWTQTKPDSIAAAFPAEEITYQSLHARATRLLHIMRRDASNQGFNHQQTLGIYIHNGVDFVTAFFAATLSGQRVAVFDPTWTRAQLVNVLESVSVDTVLTEERYIDLFQDIGARIHTLKHDDPTLAEAGPPHEYPQRDSVDYQHDDPFFIGFTSGTTSAPKGFIRSRGSWSCSFAISSDVFQAGPRDVTLAPGPLAHGLTLYALVESLYSGGLFVGIEKFSLDSVSAIAFEYRPTRLVCVPTVISGVTENQSSHPWLHDVDTVVTSGAKISTRQLDRLFSVAPSATHYEYYGASELGFVSYRTNHSAGMGKTLEEAETDVGVPFPSVMLAVGAAGPLEEDEVGTLYVQSPLVSNGYLTPSEHGFRRESDWCTVGDRGFIAGGRLHMIGREGDMLIKHGNNIYPSEVEMTLDRHPAIREACVFLDSSESELIAVVTAKPTDAPLTYLNLRAFLSGRIARYKIPKSFNVVNEMPRTNSGKIARGILSRLYSQGDATIEELR